jgi:antitoxin PrlF
MAMNAHSKLSSKAQTVIPKAIRERLGLKPGDTIRYRLEGGVVAIERASADDPFAAFTEWASEADEKAFDKL